VTFTDERLMADRALEAKDSEAASYPPTAERFRAARVRLGLSEHEVAKRWGLEASMYRDLELYDNEVFTCIDLDDVPKLARVLETPVMTLLFGSEPESLLAPVPYEGVARRIAEEATRRSMDLEQLAETIGWELEPIVRRPEDVGKLHLDGLYDICSAVGLDWVAVLAGAAMRTAERRNAADTI
jgi:transcriptional regulator with XRE-family HTH domain